jgi:hypothetical protein
MSNVEITYYKGFAIQALVHKYDPGFKRIHERLYEVSVRIGREGEPQQGSSVFKVPLTDHFQHFGDARRAGVAYAQKIIAGEIPGLCAPSMSTTATT